jgi:hypothetical protein
MSQNSASLLYQKFYVDMQLERRTLLELLDPHTIQTVLYPGSSFHITPSFYFPHVVYVDPGEHARRFFENMDQVRTIIRSNKHYKRSSYIQYIDQDIREPLPLNDLNFDLLIALYVGNAARFCKRYLKIHGLFLTNNHHNDGGLAAEDPDFQLIGVIHQKATRMMLSVDNLNQYFIRKSSVTHKGHHAFKSDKPVYSKNADYYLFRRIS